MGLDHASQGHLDPAIDLFPTSGLPRETHGQDGRAPSHARSTYDNLR